MNPNLLIHWWQITAGDGILQPWFYNGGFSELERRVIDVSSRYGIDHHCYWEINGWTPQTPANCPRPEMVGKIPFITFKDGRSNIDPQIWHIEIAWLSHRTFMTNSLGFKILPYAGCPRFDRFIWQYRNLPPTKENEGQKEYRGLQIRSNIEAYAGLPLVLDKMTDVGPDWLNELRFWQILRNYPLILEGGEQPPEDFGWFIMHKFLTDERRQAIKQSSHPWKGVLIRSDADLNGADRKERVSELTDAGVHVIIDVATVLP